MLAGGEMPEDWLEDELDDESPLDAVPPDEELLDWLGFTVLPVGVDV